jgi:hypothetical protein
MAGLFSDDSWQATGEDQKRNAMPRPVGPQLQVCGAVAQHPNLTSFSVHRGGTRLNIDR